MVRVRGRQLKGRQPWVVFDVVLRMKEIEQGADMVFSYIRNQVDIESCSRDSVGRAGNRPPDVVPNSKGVEGFDHRFQSLKNASASHFCLPAKSLRSPWASSRP